MARIHRMTAKKLKTYQKRLKRAQAKMGEGDGTTPVISGHPYLVKVRQIGSSLPYIVHNIRGAPNIDGWPVVIGESDAQRRVLQVLETNINVSRDLPGASGPVAHAASHFLDGTDPVYIHTKQVTPLAIYPVTGMTVAINPGWLTYPTGGAYVAYQTLDLTGDIPANACYVALQVDTAGTLTSKAGSDISLADLDWGDAPAADSGNKVLYYARLYAGMTAISNSVHSPDLFDVRFVTFGESIPVGDIVVAAGHMDITATTSIDLNAPTVVIGNGAAGVDYVLQFNGENSDLNLTYMEDEGYLKTDQEIRAATTLYRRYYHLSLGSFNPGASGATWTAPTANTLGGWRLDAASEVLYLQTDVHADWDGASDLTVEIKFEVNVDNTGGGAGDTVDLKLVCYYKGNAETACKTQTVEVANVVGASAQYKRFTSLHAINFDEVDNVVEAGDVIRMILNLETDTSEVDDIVVNSAEVYYNTTHLGIEAGDT